jgi:hypothetical protein
MGKGFCCVARQKRITPEGDYFYVDLVFYNRLLRCFVLVDLKLAKLTHQDRGQMQMYVHFFDRFQREEAERQLRLAAAMSDQGPGIKDQTASPCGGEVTPDARRAPCKKHDDRRDPASPRPGHRRFR